MPKQNKKSSTQRSAATVNPVKKIKIKSDHFDQTGGEILQGLISGMTP